MREKAISFREFSGPHMVLNRNKSVGNAKIVPGFFQHLAARLHVDYFISIVLESWMNV